MSGTLVALEVPYVFSERWGETRVNTQESIDFYLRPDQRSRLQPLKSRNNWFPFQFSNALTNRYAFNTIATFKIPYKTIIRSGISTVPAFIYTGALLL